MFRLNLFIRISLLFLNLLLLAYMIVGTELIAATCLVGLFAVIQVGALFWYVSQTNRFLTRFFDSIQHDDFSLQAIPTGKGKSFDQLGQRMETVLTQFRKIRAAQDQSYRYLDRIIQHTGTAMIAITADEQVNLVNHAAKRLFRLNPIHRLNALPKVVAETVRDMKSGEKRIVKLAEGAVPLQLVLHLTAFRLGEEDFRLISFQNIQSEMERTEVNAWQKLIRVLTHEIMNSVTPVSTIAETLKGMFFQGNDYVGAVLSEVQVEDARHAISLIQKRSDGLLHFVETYRSLTRVPQPEFESISLKQFVEDLERLFRNRIKDEAVAFSANITPENLEIITDPKLLEQVMINLIINALQAMEGCAERKLSLSILQEVSGEVLIQLTDTGKGIDAMELEQIFIPFYSSKKEGSGIGLSISRQIIHTLGGSIHVQSVVGEGTQFVVEI